MDENEFNGKRRDLRDENTTEGVCDCRIEADQGKRRFELIILVEFDFEVLLVKDMRGVSSKIGFPGGTAIHS